MYNIIFKSNEGEYFLKGWSLVPLMYITSQGQYYTTPLNLTMDLHIPLNELQQTQIA